MFRKELTESVRYKFLKDISAILLISTFVLTTLIALNERRMLKHSLMTKGHSFVSYIANLSQDPLIMKNYIQLDLLVNEANKDEDILYIVIRDTQGNILTSQFASINYQSPLLKGLLSGLSKESEFPDILSAIKKNEDLLELSVPILTGGDRIGEVALGISQYNIRKQILKTVLFVIALNLAVMFVLGSVLFIASKKSILDPIIELSHAADRLAKGDLSTHVNIPAAGEVRMLVDSFNKMAHDLEKTTVSKEYVDKIFKSMIDTLIVASPDGTIRTVNDAARTLLGYREEELTGQPIKRIFPEDGDRVFDEFVRYGLMKNTEYTYVTKDNRKIPVLLSSSVIYSGDATAQGIVCVAVDITERKNAENNILRSRQTMQAILGSMPYGVVIIGKDKKIRSANEAALKLMNYDAEKQIVGMTCNHSLCPAQEGKCPIIDLDEKLDRAERILITKNGERIPILKTVVPVEIDGEDVLLEAFVDITERKRAEESLQESEKRYRMLFEGAGDAIFILDAEGSDPGRIVAANKTAAELHGYTVEELLKKNIRDLDTSAAAQRAPGIIRRILNGEWIKEDSQHLKKSGAVFPVEISAGLLDLGRHKYILAFDRDISERKHAEDKLQRYAADLEQINEEMKNFAYIVSHDLRAPLVNIKGFSDELGRSIKEFTPLLEKYRERVDEEEKQRTEDLLKKDIPEALGFIGSSVTRMDALINSILKLSRLGRNELKPELFRTENIVQTLLESLAHQIDMHKAEVTIGPLPDLIMDRTAAEQIFGNLLDNALKYLEPARSGKIEITAEQNTQEVIFTVRDNGRGIAKEDTQKVFELFRRVGRQEVPGEGMGLTYVKTLVRRLGGRIWCESEPGAGTAFKFTIPNKDLTENEI